MFVIFSAFLLMIPAARLLGWDSVNAPSYPTTTKIGEAAKCDKYAAVGGSNGAKGTKSEPFRTAQKLVDSLKPGQAGCLRSGVYTKDDGVLLFEDGGSRGHRITLQPYPGEKVTVRAQLKVPEGSNHIIVRSLTLDGTAAPTGRRLTNQNRWASQPSPFVQGDDTQWVNNDVTKRNENALPWQTGVCFLVGGSGIDNRVEDTLIEGNRIHNCGPQADQPKGPDNHGIYVSNASGAIIRDNLIYSNGERGIQLYPKADNTLVSGNVVDGNGQGLVVDAKSSNNTVRGNVFSNPRVSWNVYQGPKLSGTGNRVNSNCFWTPEGSSGLKNGGLIAATGNVVANPRYQSSGDFKVTNPTCLAKYSGTMAR